MRNACKTSEKDAPGELRFCAFSGRLVEMEPLIWNCSFWSAFGVPLPDGPAATEWPGRCTHSAWGGCCPAGADVEEPATMEHLN